MGLGYKLALAFSVAMSACDQAAEPGGPVGAGSGGAGASPGGGAGGGGTGGGSPATCSPAYFSGVVGSVPAGQVCTAVLRIPPAPTRFAVTCGPPGSITLANAQALAQAGLDPAGLGNASGALPNAYVFFHDPMDFGGVALVSAQTGLLALKIKTEFALDAPLPPAMHPPAASWLEPTPCASTAKMPAAKGILLGGGQSPIAEPLDDASTAAAMSALANTSIADELASRGAIHWALVLQNKAAGPAVIIEAGPLE
ncbi:MAG: hypothetical protein IT375_28685 [Polyangiaceae bacterium]|nr:hypothetical protein [Polyangiaceae bacterium]